MRTVPREEGFSLVEMIVVLAILSLAMVVSIPFVRGSGEALQLDAEARIVAARLREARTTAMLARRQGSVVIRFQPPGVSGPGQRPFYAFRSAKRLQVLTAKGLVTGDSAEFLFMADGGSTGGEIRLFSTGASRTLRIDWLTGAVEDLTEIKP